MNTEVVQHACSPVLYAAAHELLTHATTLKADPSYRVTTDFRTDVADVRAAAHDIVNLHEPGQTISVNRKLYLARWFLDPGSGFPGRTYLHRFVSNDPDEPHDHPWPSAGRILEGEMTEYWWQSGEFVYRTSRDPVLLSAGTAAIRPAAHAHRLERSGASVNAPRETSPLTLFVTLEKERDWGFWVRDEGFVHWDEFERRGDRDRQVDFHQPAT